jgi:hypothetical protein
MYHYDPHAALEELKDEALLPHPVHLRDMILRARLDPATAVELNRDFQQYLGEYGTLEKLAGAILERLASAESKRA